MTVCGSRLGWLESLPHVKHANPTRKHTHAQSAGAWVSCLQARRASAAHGTKPSLTPSLAPSLTLRGGTSDTTPISQHAHTKLQHDQPATQRHTATQTERGKVKALLVLQAYGWIGLWVAGLVASVGLIVGMAVGLVSVVREDFGRVLAALRQHADESDGQGFTMIKSESWLNLARRATQFLDVTRAAAALGMRSAADKLKSKQSSLNHAFRQVFRPFLYIVLGFTFSQWLELSATQKLAGGSKSSYKLDRMTAVFVQTVIKCGVLTLFISYLLRGLGVPAQWLDAVLASAGIAVGIASQKVLQNLASGIVLLFFRPFKIGGERAREPSNSVRAYTRKHNTQNTHTRTQTRSRWPAAWRAG